MINLANKALLRKSEEVKPVENLVPTRKSSRGSEKQELENKLFNN